MFQLIIVLDDYNDNPPLFTEGKYEKSIIETTPPDTVIIQVTATDADQHPENGKVSYRITAGNDKSNQR